MLPWLVAFARRCNETDHATGRLALGALAGRCFELLDSMASDGVDVEVQRAPLLVAAKDPDLAQTFLARLRPLSRLGFGVPAQVLGEEEIRSLEPALTGAVRAGFLIEQHRIVEPQSLLAGLARRLAELDVEIEEGTEVRDVELENERLVSLQTSAGRYRGDQVVLAPGAWLGPLARLLEARLPVQAGKGYSFEVRPRRMPRYPLLLLEPHVGCSPFGDRLRIAGTMEFSGLNARVDWRRVRAIADGALTMIEGWQSLDRDTVWSGLRPIAPDGLPVIDRHPRIGNLFFAGAYSMLGVTLAAAAAEKLAVLVLTGRRPPELEPFGAARFRFVGWRV
jgi:D-amino-acid dehydrogenase